MTGRSTNGESTSYAWLDTGLVGTVTTVSGWITTIQTSTYDKSGNKLTEYQTRSGDFIQHAHAEYDALGRLTRWYEDGSVATANTPAIPFAELRYEYDANSNIRRRIETASLINANNTVSGPYAPVSRWFAYDKMNRVTISDGTLSGGVIDRGGGQLISYDAAGQRATVTVTSENLVWDGWYNSTMGYSTDPVYDWPEYYTWEEVTLTYTGTATEHYYYNDDGLLTNVALSYETADPNSGSPTVNGGWTDESGVASFGYDAMGRLSWQNDYTANGDFKYGRSGITYDAAGRITFEKQQTWQGSQLYTTEITNNYGTAGTSGYALGALVWSQSNTLLSGNDAAVPDTRTDYGYAWYDGPVQQTITHDSDTGNYSNTPYVTTTTLTATGVTASANIVDSRPRDVTFLLDALGQVIRRDEAAVSNPSANAPHQVWYRFNGAEMGTVGNDGINDDNYVDSVNSRTLPEWSTSTVFRNGLSGSRFAKFGTSIDPITSYSQGSAGGGYTAQGGETLSSVAAQLWGDSSLWYRLAEANGLGTDAMLAAGQHLTVPMGVTRNTNSATTFRPYDPAAAIGDISPTEPAPQAKKKNSCGVFGQLLVMVISVAITVALPGAGVVSGALNGFTGSMIGQMAGVATGLQEDFNLSAVAMAAIGGGIGGALQGVNVAGTGSSLAKVASDVARGMIGNTLTQGIAVATGLQHKCDFAGVAVAGLVGGVGGAAARGLASKGGLFGIHAGLGSAGSAFLSATASGVAGAASRSLLEGTDFGDNLLAVLPDVVGTTIGRAMAAGGRHRDSGLLSRAPEQVNELATSGGAGVQAELAAIVAAGGPSLSSALSGSASAAGFAEASANGSVAPSGYWHGGTFERFNGPGHMVDFILKGYLSPDYVSRLDGYVADSTKRGFGINTIADLAAGELAGRPHDIGNVLSALGFTAGKGSSSALPLAEAINVRMNTSALYLTAPDISDTSFMSGYDIGGRIYAWGAAKSTRKHDYTTNNSLRTLAGAFYGGFKSTMTLVGHGIISSVGRPFVSQDIVAISDMRLSDAFSSLSVSNVIVGSAEPFEGLLTYDDLRPAFAAAGSSTATLGLVKGGSVARRGLGAADSAAVGRTFVTKDPGVGPLIEAIEARAPGTVRHAEIEIYRPDGTPYTDFDIVTDTHVIQVKVGGGKGIVPQIQTSQGLTHYPVVGFDANGLIGSGRTFKPTVMRNAQQNGIQIYSDVDSLMLALGK
jgi:hypothetical protein